MNARKPFQTIALTVGFVAAGVMLCADNSQALEEQAQIALGKAEYMAHCASCHGEKGKGNGPVAEVLQQKPTDLTQLAKKYSGSFPQDELYRVIDGRKMINPHGDRQMPVWGHRFMVGAVQRSGEVPHEVNAQALVHGRITALIQYLESIQVN